MTDEGKTELRLEIAHVLFMDIVGYSKRLVDEQREALHELNHLVLHTDAVRNAEAMGSLIRLPTGDGMALVFTNSMEAPVECALQIGQALRTQPSLPLRMGIHSGPVQYVSDVNDRSNVAGSGINIAQRVMDCGDAGHILASKRVADDLATLRRWQPLLHDLGEVAVKHGQIVSLVNVYAEAVGNPALPTKFGDAQAARRKPPDGVAPTLSGRRWLYGAGAAVLLAAAALGFGLRHWTASGRIAVATIPPPPASTPAAVLPEKSVAVLPFDNFSEDKDSAFFADGVQDEVLTVLSHVADLKVISRSSVIQYKDARQRNLREIGKALGVAYVVEGSVQRAGNRIKVNAQLIDTRTDAHQWAEQYVRDLADVFAIQSEIAQSIAGQLRAAISPQEHAAMAEVPTRDERAYELYLQARSLWNDYYTADTSRVDYHVIIDLLKQAVARDPGFVRAYALMTEVESYQYFNLEKTPETAEAARLYAETAARLRPGSTDANLAMGYYDYYVRGDYARAHENFAAVVRQSPNDARALFCLGSVERRQRQWDEGLGNMRRALELDPERNSYTETYLEVLTALRRYPEAQAFLDRLINTHPKRSWLRTERAMLWLNWKADTPAVRAELAALPPSHDPDATLILLLLTCDEFDRDFASAQRTLEAWPLADIDGLPRALFEGDVARLRGDATAATAKYNVARPVMDAVVRAQPDNFSVRMELAMVDASMGNRDAALEEGRRALAIAPQEDAQVLPRLKGMWLLVLARSGEREEAIRILQTLVGQPYGPNYGDLHLNPEWDPLRTDPRFVALVAALAPKP